VSGRTRLIAAGVIALLLLGLFYLFLIRPRKSELSDLRAQVEQENSRTITLTTELKHLRELQANAPRAQAELSRIQQFVPKTTEQADFILQVDAAAKQANVDFVNVVSQPPKTPPEGAQLAEVLTEVDARGGYFAIQDFIRRLHDLRRAVRIDGMDITSEEDPVTGDTVLVVKMNARIFFELPAASGIVPVTPVPGETPAPVTSPVP
jgi:Tfp pilus assembly protein PilO